MGQQVTQVLGGFGGARQVRLGAADVAVRLAGGVEGARGVALAPGGAVGVLFANVKLGVLQQGLGGLEGALVVGVVADDHFAEQGGARCPQGRQHGQQHEDDDDEQGHAALVGAVTGRAAGHGGTGEDGGWRGKGDGLHGGHGMGVRGAGQGGTQSTEPTRPWLRS